MGLAKYFEDNNKLTEERYYFRESSVSYNINSHVIFSGRCDRNESKNNYKSVKKYSENVKKDFYNRIYYTIDQDRILYCRECGEYFTFSVGEQKFYKKKNLCEPRRCKACREKKKLVQAMWGW